MPAFQRTLNSFSYRVVIAGAKVFQPQDFMENFCKVTKNFMAFLIEPTILLATIYAHFFKNFPGFFEIIRNFVSVFDV